MAAVLMAILIAAVGMMLALTVLGTALREAAQRRAARSDSDALELSLEVARLVGRLGWTDVHLLDDRGSDLVALDPAGKRVLVRCVDDDETDVRATALRAGLAATRHARADRLLHVTSGDYADDAQEFARAHPDALTIWDAARFTAVGVQVLRLARD